MTTLQESNRRSGRHRENGGIGLPEGELRGALYLAGIFVMIVGVPIIAGAYAWWNALTG